MLGRSVWGSLPIRRVKVTTHLSLATLPPHSRYHDAQAKESYGWTAISERDVNNERNKRDYSSIALGDRDPPAVFLLLGGVGDGVGAAPAIVMRPRGIDAGARRS